jgi:hypothetical protein
MLGVLEDRGLRKVGEEAYSSLIAEAAQVLSCAIDNEPGDSEANGAVMFRVNVLGRNSEGSGEDDERIEGSIAQVSLFETEGLRPAFYAVECTVKTKDPRSTEPRK